MTRVKTGFKRHRKHKKILKAAKGYYSSRSTLFKRANEAVLKSGEYAFFGRKLKKRNFRKLWIIRINAALKELGIKYSTFINSLKKNNITLNRKSLASFAQDKKAFKKFAESLKSK